ncbi:hypothetical protein PLESTF_000320000 [Pleodorina starrii]|nr:hypothetical protein PLESTF_000320000 [Pleodorina starrii]
MRPRGAVRNVCPDTHHSSTRRLHCTARLPTRRPQTAPAHQTVIPPVKQSFLARQAGKGEDSDTPQRRAELVARLDWVARMSAAAAVTAAASGRTSSSPAVRNISTTHPPKQERHSNQQHTRIPHTVQLPIHLPRYTPQTVLLLRGESRHVTSGVCTESRHTSWSPPLERVPFQPTPSAVPPAQLEEQLHSPRALPGCSNPALSPFARQQPQQQQHQQQGTAAASAVPLSPSLSTPDVTRAANTPVDVATTSESE